MQQRMTGRMHRALTLGGASLFIVAFAACGDDTVTGGERRTIGAYRLLSQRAVGRTLDDALVQLSADIPGFGGIFVREGVPQILLTDPAALPEARAVLARTAPFLGWDLQRLRASQAEFVLPDLARWRASLRPVIVEIPGFSFLDLDESRNRVTIGVTVAGAEAAVMQAARASGIPEQAIRVELVQPLQLLQGAPDLVSRGRPTVGGLQIVTDGPAYPGGPDRVRQCTLGIGTRARDEAGELMPQRFIMTASHCSSESFGLDASDLYQPTLSPNNLMGYEFRDPQPRTNCGFGTLRCRWGEVALFTLYDTTAAFAARWRIGRTNGACIGCPGSTVINTAPNDYFDVPFQDEWGSFYWPLVGERSDIMGHRVGWSLGEITRTCFDVRWRPPQGDPDPGVMMQCQWENDAVAYRGDSGSPIFGPAGWSGPDGREKAMFHGIAWAALGVLDNDSWNGPVIFTMWEQADWEVWITSIGGT